MSSRCYQNTLVIGALLIDKFNTVSIKIAACFQWLVDPPWIKSHPASITTVFQVNWKQQISGLPGLTNLCQLGLFLGWWKQKKDTSATWLLFSYFLVLSIGQNYLYLATPQPPTFEHLWLENSGWGVFPDSKIDFSSCTTPKTFRYEKDCCVEPHFSNRLLLSAISYCSWERKKTLESAMIYMTPCSWVLCAQY